MTYTWQTASGEVIPISDLSNEHLINVMGVVHKRGLYPTLSVPADEFASDPDTYFVDALIKEAEKRELRHPWQRD